MLGSRRSPRAALASPRRRLAGAQQYEVLSASVRATLANAVNDRASVDMKDLDTRAWVRGMTRRVVARFPDEEAARQFLALVRYEAMRAGLDPHLVLAVIDVESKFRKYAVSKAGRARPDAGDAVLGEGDRRPGRTTSSRSASTCATAARSCATTSTASTATSPTRSARYNGSLGRPEYSNAVFRALKDRWALSATKA